ncbi:MAG TPA: hypothetical protein VFF15_09690 [Flavobacteriaceae bacterium]|nr:hypothetical protein [Flavobacteriaceae bacterium]
MNDDTLYYTLSTIPQVLAAFMAIAIAFLFFRIAQIKDFLIGDGITSYDRIKLNEPGHSELGDKYNDRLRDAISRKNIDEIDEILRMLKDKEIEQGYNLINRPNGLQYNYDSRFVPTKNFMSRVLKWTICLLILSTISILASLISLGAFDQIKKCGTLELFLWSNVILFTFCLIGFVIVIAIGLFYKLPYEKRRVDKTSP